MARTRKRWWLLAAILACCAGGALWQAKAHAHLIPLQKGKLSDSDRLAITKVLIAQQAAWNRGDIEAFLEGYWHSQELSFSGSNGITRGFEGVRERYRRSYGDRAAMGELEISELEFRLLGPDAALVLGHWHLKREKGDVGGVFTLVWRRFPGGWRIIHDHTSVVP